MKKIIWLCAFSNDELAEKLPLLTNPKTVSPWMSEFVDLFRNNLNFKIYIISPNYLNNTNINLCIGNIDVYLYKFYPCFLSEKFYNLTLNYNLTNRNVSKLVQEINPDLIHLFGAENPVYSSAIVNNRFNCPILVSPQAFIRNSSLAGSLIKRFIRWNRIRFESKILKEQKYFTVATNDVVDELNKTNPESIKFKMAYPTTFGEPFQDLISDNQEFDISYFAQISKEKGIEDFLELVVRLKQKFSNIRAVIIGGGNELYIKQIKRQLINHGLSENIYFAGFQKTQKEAFNLLRKSKVYVLPTFHDGLPGTIREAMYLKVAVVAYGVGGIPSLNDKSECIKCVPVHSLDLLLIEVISLLKDEQYRSQLINNAYRVITQDFNNENVYSDLVNIYNKILK